MHRIRLSSGCRPCGSRRFGLAHRIGAAEAGRRLTAAGWVAQEDYPGLSHASWRVACAQAGHPRRTGLQNILTQPSCRTCREETRSAAA